MFESITENVALWLIAIWFVLGAFLIIGASWSGPAAQGRLAPGESADAIMRPIGSPRSEEPFPPQS